MTDYTLANVLRDAWIELGQYEEHLATGGATTSVTDTVRATKDGQDDKWKDGTCMIIKTTDGAAPQGQFQRISASVNSTGVVTVDTAFTATAGAGDTYALIRNKYPLRTMVQVVNLALRSLGDIPVAVDTTTLDSASSQTEYALSTAWKRGILRIDQQTKTGDADDNRWMTIYDWEAMPSAAGAAAIFTVPQLTASRDLRIWYLDIHPTISTYSDVISEYIHPYLATSIVVEQALKWKNSRANGQDKFLLQRWNDAKNQTDLALSKFQIKKPTKRKGIFVPREWNISGVGSVETVDLS